MTRDVTELAIRNLLGQIPRSIPFRMLDIGASGGLQNRWKPFRDCIEFVLVEPDPETAKKLIAEIRPGDAVIERALGSKVGVTDFNIAENRECSSIFKPNMGFLEKFSEPTRFQIASTTEITTATLDEELAARALSGIDFIKIDTQGAELGILAGGIQTISNDVLGIEVEVEFSPLYVGQPLFSDVDSFLQSKGFYLFDLSRHFWRRTGATPRGAYRGQVIWADALYLKSEYSLNNTLNTFNDTKLRGGKLAKAIIVALLYGYPDYALGLIQGDPLIDNEEKEFISRQIYQVLASKWSVPDFRGKTRLASMLRRISDALSTDHFNSDDPGLGNRW